MVRSHPDFGILLALAYRCFTDQLADSLTEAGFPETRPAYGYVFRALDAENLTLSELAARLRISKQATAKVVDELESRGLISRRADRPDRREKSIRLTQRAREIMATALHIGAQAEAELVAQFGPAALVTLRDVLTTYIEQHGGLEDSLARRARPVW